MASRISYFTEPMAGQAPDLIQEMPDWDAHGKILIRKVLAEMFGNVVPAEQIYTSAMMKAWPPEYLPTGTLTDYYITHYL